MFEGRWCLSRVDECHRDGLTLVHPGKLSDCMVLRFCCCKTPPPTHTHQRTSLLKWCFAVTFEVKQLIFLGDLIHKFCGLFRSKQNRLSLDKPLKQTVFFSFLILLIVLFWTLKLSILSRAQWGLEILGWSSASSTYVCWWFAAPAETHHLLYGCSKRVRGMVQMLFVPFEVVFPR